MFAVVGTSGCGPHYTSIVSYKVDTNGRLGTGAYVWERRGDASFAISSGSTHLCISTDVALQNYRIQPDNSIPKEAGSVIGFHGGDFEMPRAAPVVLFDGGKLLVRACGANLSAVPILRDGKLGDVRNFQLSMDGRVKEQVEPPPAEFAPPAEDAPTPTKSPADLAYIVDIRSSSDGRLYVFTQFCMFVFDSINPDIWITSKARRVPYVVKDIAELQLRPMRSVMATR